MNKKAWIGAAAAGAAAYAAREYWLKSHEDSLAGEVALVTGGSRGLGLALAKELARVGCRIAICARDAAELETAKAALQRNGGEVFTIACDLTKRADVEQMISAVTDYFGQIDILVNNAGIIEVGPVEDMRVADFERAMNSIFWVTVYPTMTALPAFLARGSGRIVNISSIGGKIGVPHLLPYSAAKFAVGGFSDGLAAELRPKGIHVTTIYPGLMRTGSFNQASFHGDYRREATWFTLGSTLPGVSMDAQRAARQIVSAVKRRESERILSLPAQAIASLKKLFPGGTNELLSVAASAQLPKATGAPGAKSGWALWDKMHPAVKLAGTLGIRAMRQYN